LPDDFLGYGKWWNSQINLKIKKHNIGNPNYKYPKSLEFKDIKKRKKILFISDGLDTEKYINLANNLFILIKKDNYDIYIRPHPIECSSSWINDKNILQNIKVDIEKNIYKSLLKKIWLKQDFGKEHRYFYILSKDLTKLEETFAKNLNDVENSSTEFKKDLKNLLLDSVKEVEVFSAK
jgi:hypothetical protein